MSSYDCIGEYCWYIHTNQYPFYFPIADSNGDVTTGYILKPSEFFTGLGLPNPRNYYMEQIYSD